MWSKGITWIDDCRIPFVDENTSRKQTSVKVEVYGCANHKGQMGSFDDSAKQGRFPANLLVSDDMLNDGIDRKGFNGGGGPSRFANAKGGKKLDDYNYYGDKGSSSRYYDIDKWFNNLIDV